MTNKPAPSFTSVRRDHLPCRSNSSDRVLFRSFLRSGSPRSALLLLAGFVCTSLSGCAKEEQAAEKVKPIVLPAQLEDGKLAYSDFLAASKNAGKLDQKLLNTPEGELEFEKAGLDLYAAAFRALANGDVSTGVDRSKNPHADYRPMLILLDVVSVNAANTDDVARSAEATMAMFKAGMLISYDGRPEDRSIGRRFAHNGFTHLSKIASDLSSVELQEFQKVIDRWLEFHRAGLVGLSEKEDPTRPGFSGDFRDRSTQLFATQLRLAKIVIAIELFQRENGQYPADLEALGLQADSMADYDSSVFKYKRDGELYKVYSVGPDEVDGGGQSTEFGILESGSPGDLSLAS